MHTERNVWFRELHVELMSSHLSEALKTGRVLTTQKFTVDVRCRLKLAIIAVLHADGNIV